MSEIPGVIKLPIGQLPRLRIEAEKTGDPAHRLVTSREYQDFVLNGATSWGSDAVETIDRADLLGPGLFAATTAWPSGRAAPMLQPRADLPIQDPGVLGLVYTTTTDTDIVPYLEETTRVDPGVETAHGTAYQEATSDFQRVDAVIRDIGVFAVPQRATAEDLGQFSAFMAQVLHPGLVARLDSQIVNGDGVGENLPGILNTATIAHYDRDGTNNESLYDAIRGGIAVVWANFKRPPDAVLINPADWELIEEEENADGERLLSGEERTQQKIGATPVVLTPVIAQDSALVGAFRLGATAWFRTGVMQRVTGNNKDTVNLVPATRSSGEHEDFFTKRLLAVIAELRVAFAAWSGSAFCEVDLS
jgi:HK97 family phage major capsid protein